MSWTPGDYNNDGKADYVDYKIYTTQIDPNSGEYQGPPSSSGSGIGSLITWGIIAFIALAAFSFVAENIGSTAQFLYALALIIAFQWKGCNLKYFPMKKVYSRILSLLTLALIIWLIYNTSARLTAMMAGGRYINSADYWLNFIDEYSAAIIGGLLLILGLLKSSSFFTIIGLCAFCSPLLKHFVTFLMQRYGFFPYIIPEIMPLIAFFFLMSGFRRPHKRFLLITSIMLGLLSFLLPFLFYSSIYALRNVRTELVLVLTTAIFIYLSNRKASSFV